MTSSGFPVIVIIHRDIFIITRLIFLNLTNRQCGVMLTSSAVDRRFENRSGQTKDYEIGISCFSAKHATLWSKSKNWLLGIGIMCPSGATYLHLDCCFSDLALYNFQNRHHQQIYCSFCDIGEKVLI